MDSPNGGASSVKSAEDGRIKLLCSHGGSILCKSDGQLRYTGGVTRLVSVHRSIGYAELMNRLEKLFGSNLWLKYQLPHEDLDSLVSVTCDEDVANLLEEYDHNEARHGASRVRAFLFPAARMPFSPAISASSDLIGNEDYKSPMACLPVKRHALPHQADVPPATFQVPDYLFGLENNSDLYSHVSDTGKHQLEPRSGKPQLVVVNKDVGRGWPNRGTDFESNDNFHAHVEKFHTASSQQDKLQQLPCVERSTVDSWHPIGTAASPLAMQELTSRGTSTYESQEFEFCTDSSVASTGTASSDLQWDSPQLTVAGFDSLSERHLQSHRGSGSSDEAGYGPGDSAARLTCATSPTGFQNGLMAQDATKVHQAEEQHQHGLGDLENSSALHPSHEACLHHLGKGHFQQVHWQLDDSPEQQKPHLFLDKPKCIIPAFKRHAKPLNYEVVSSDNRQYCMPDNHQYCMPFASIKTRAMPHSRVPSSTDMKVPSSGILPSEAQHFYKASSPLRDHSPDFDSLGPFRYRQPAFQMGKLGHLPPVQPRVGPAVPVGQLFATNDGYGACYQTAEDFNVSHVALDKIRVGTPSFGRGQLHDDGNLQANLRMLMIEQQVGFQ